MLFGSTGCSTRNLGTEYDFRNLNGKTILFGSISQTKTSSLGGPYGWLYYKGPKIGWFLTRKEKVPASYVYDSGDFKSVTGRIIMVELPPGDYIFYNWRVNNGTSATIHPRTAPEEIKFALKEGEINYIGNFHFEMIKGTNKFGVKFIAASRLSIRNEFERDYRVATERYGLPEKNDITFLTKTNRDWYPSDQSEIIVDPLPVTPAAIQ